MELDRLIGEVQLLRREFPEAKDFWAYAYCIYDQIYSYWKRRDKPSFKKALKSHEEIDLAQVTFNSNIFNTRMYIEFACQCFDL